MALCHVTTSGRAAHGMDMDIVFAPVCVCVYVCVLRVVIWLVRSWVLAASGGSRGGSTGRVRLYARVARDMRKFWS